MSKFLVIIMAALLNMSIGINANANTERQDSELQQVLREAELLLRNNQATAAFALLDPYSSNHAGDIEYDHLYGLSALRSGKPGTAIFALERAAALSPKSGTIILDLARAYFDAKDFTQARLTFHRVLELNPPSAILQIIEDYQAQINKHLRPYAFDLDVTLGLSGGNDSNANNGSPYEAIWLNNILLFLSDQAKKTQSVVTGIDGKARMSYTWRKRTALYAEVLAQKTHYLDAPFVNNTHYSVSGGLTYKGKRIQSSNIASIQRTDLSDKVNSYTGMAISDQQYNVSASSAIALFGYAGMNKYPHYDVQDNMFIYGGTRASQVIGPSILSASLYAGWHRPEQSTSSFAQKVAGMNLGIRTQVARHAQMFANIGAKYSDYYRGFIGQTREDGTGKITTGFIIKPFKKWILRPEMTLIKTKSTVDIFEYDKLKVSVSIQSQLL